MELRDFVRIAWKRKWAVLLVALLTTGLGAVFAIQKPDNYESTATVAFTPNFKGGTYIPADTVDALVQTYAQTAKSRFNLQRARNFNGGRRLPGSVKTGTQTGASVLTITGRAHDPNDAAVTARAATQAFIASLSNNGIVQAKVVDPATPSATPVQPRPPLIIAAAAILGLAGGLLLGFALEHFRRRVQTSADVAEFTPAPVIGRLPKQRALSQNGASPVWRVGIELPRLAHIQEAFRALRTNIEFLTTPEGTAFQVTSPVPGQGKSTVVANLGIALAQIGVDTVIVDADLRRPTQHEVFGVPNDRGLSTRLVIGGSDPEPLPTDYPHLRVLPSGPVPHISTELLHIRFRRVLEELRASRATILIDSPPLLPISDARVIAPMADGVLMVIDAANQRPAQLRAAIEKLELGGATLLGVVLNRSGEEIQVRGGYEYYGYGDAPTVTASESTSSRE